MRVNWPSTPEPAKIPSAKNKNDRPRVVFSTDEPSTALSGKAIRDIKDYVDDIESQRTKSQAPKRLIEFKTQGRSAWDKVLPDRWDEDDSAGPPAPHLIGLTPIQSPPLADSGPFSENMPPHPATAGDDTADSDGAGHSDGAAGASPEAKMAENPAPSAFSENKTADDAALKTVRRDRVAPRPKTKPAATDEDDDDEPYAVRSRDI